jgi:peptidyl-prolyl cis-trans isomerase A (cyclophilin A)
LLLAVALGTGCKNDPKPSATPAEPVKATTPPPPPPPEPAKPAEAVVEKLPEAPKPVESPKPAELSGELAALKNPAQLTAKAPPRFKVRFTTSKGDFVIEATRDWAPNGVDRFYNLVKAGYFTDVRFFRAIAGFMVQFGIHGDGRVNNIWREARISDDPVKESNKRGHVTFATAGPDTRTTQLFINFRDNTQLDSMGFAPFARVIKGMDVVDKLHTDYGEGAPSGRGPHQGRLQAEGNDYLKKEFPDLDYIKSAKIEK